MKIKIGKTERTFVRVPAREMNAGEMFVSLTKLAIDMPDYKGPWAVAHVTFPFGSVDVNIFKDSTGQLSTTNNYNYTKAFLAPDIASAVIERVEAIVKEQEELDYTFDVTFNRFPNSTTKMKGSATLNTGYGTINGITYGWNPATQQVLLFDPQIYIKGKEEDDAPTIRDGQYRMSPEIKELLKEEAYKFMVKEGMIVSAETVAKAVEAEKDTEEVDELETVEV